MSLEKIVRGLDIRKLRTSSGKTMERVLLEEAKLLRTCIQSRITQGSMQNVLSVPRLSDIRVVDEEHLSVALNVQNAIRPSIFKRYNGKDANVFWLLNDGFQVRNIEAFRFFPHIERWIHRDPYHWVEKGIEDYQRKSQLKHPCKVTCIRPLFYYGRHYS